jgi:site-specific recombinase XerD
MAVLEDLKRPLLKRSLSSLSSAKTAGMVKLPTATAQIFKMPATAQEGGERWITRAAELAGIPHLTWHDLRHTFASRLRMKGVDLAMIKELLGHKTITTTERYAHISPSFHAEAVKKLVDFR